MGIATVVGAPTDMDFKRCKNLEAGHVKCSKLKNFGQDFDCAIDAGWILKETGASLRSFADATRYHDETGKCVWLWYEHLDVLAE